MTEVSLDVPLPFNNHAQQQAKAPAAKQSSGAIPVSFAQVVNVPTGLKKQNHDVIIGRGKVDWDTVFPR